MGPLKVLSALAWKRLHCTHSESACWDLPIFPTHYYYSSCNKKPHCSIQSPNLKIRINETHKMWKRPPNGEWSREVLKDTLMVMQGFNENQKFSADQPSLTHGGTARLPFHNTFVSFLLCFSPLLSLLSNPKGPSKVQFGLTYNSDVATEALHSLKFKISFFFFNWS